MSLQVITYLQAQRIIDEVETEGSGPLLIEANDDSLYYAKASFQFPTCFEVINELFCAYVAQTWELKVPLFALMTIPSSVVDVYESEKKPLSVRYSKRPFDEVVFFASKKLRNFTEFESYIKGVDKKDFKLFLAPLDIIKIGILDLWIGNKDRQPKNPNILINVADDGFDFCPIDHAAAFCYCPNYKVVNNSFLFLEDRFRILTAPLVKSIAQHSPPASVQNLKNEILLNMQATLDNLDFIFEQFPVSWGFSKKAKLHLKQFLSDEERNRRIASDYLAYIK
jgi:hypothetical protein